MSALPVSSSARVVSGLKRKCPVAPLGVRKASRSQWWRINGDRAISRFFGEDHADVVAAAPASGALVPRALFRYKRPVGHRNLDLWAGLLRQVSLTIEWPQHHRYCYDQVDCTRSKASRTNYDHRYCWEKQESLAKRYPMSYAYHHVIAQTVVVKQSVHQATFRHTCHDDPNMWLESNWKMIGDLTVLLPPDLWELIKSFVPDAPIILGRMVELSKVSGRLSFDDQDKLLCVSGNRVVVTGPRGALQLGAWFSLW